MLERCNVTVHPLVSPVLKGANGSIPGCLGLWNRKVPKGGAPNMYRGVWLLVNPSSFIISLPGTSTESIKDCRRKVHASVPEKEKLGFLKCGNKRPDEANCRHWNLQAFTAGIASVTSGDGN